MEASDETQQADVTTEEPQTQEQMLQELLKEQKAHRAEIAQLRQATATAPPPPTPDVAPEDRVNARLDKMREYSHYCPGCGRLSNYRHECTGAATVPHAPIEVVSTDEVIDGDPANHTPAPPTGT